MTLRNKQLIPALIVAFAAMVWSIPAHAHFIWLLYQPGDKPTVEVYFGEEAAPDDPALLGRLKGMTLHQVQGKQSPQALEPVLADDSFSAKVPRGGSKSLFIASHDLGVFERGDSVFRLKYYAKTGPQIGSDVWRKTVCSDDLLLDVEPALKDGVLTVTVRFNEKPAAGAEVKASGPGLEEFTGTTDDAGRAAFEVAKHGVYSIRARHIENKAGELNGKKYPETRHYSTVAVNVPTNKTSVAATRLTDLPQPVTSFGAAVVGGNLYLYGGHTGGAHEYSKPEQSHRLTRFNTSSEKWETVARGPHLQGLAMVAHGGKLYRIGGFTAKNDQGEEQDLWSQDAVARFDPTEKKWSDLPPLPEPRSSHDAAAVGDVIYVVGGWAIQGGSDHDWHDTAWKLDLSKQQPTWEAVPKPPFKRRALALAAHDGKLFVVGGMQEKGGPTRRVDVFDPAAGKWSRGPDLAGDDGMTGFGASAFAAGGRLYASTVSGNLQRLKQDGSAWEVVGDTPTSRFFHRLLRLDDNRLVVVGGANMQTGKFEEVEVLDVSE